MQHALIVEDLPQTRQWLADAVRQTFAGVQVTSVARRDEALAAVRTQRFDLALIDLGLPDGSGLDVVGALQTQQAQALSVVVTIYDDDAHIFPALQAGAFGYLLKDQTPADFAAQLLRITRGEPPLSAAIARRVLKYFSQAPQAAGNAANAMARPLAPAALDASAKSKRKIVENEVFLTERETDVLQRVAKGYTLKEIAAQFGLSPHTVADYVKIIYRKLNVCCRAEAAVEAMRRGLVQL